jgi:hypothetical protein
MSDEQFVSFNIDVEDAVNLDYIDSVTKDINERTMIMVDSKAALKEQFYNYLTSYGLRDRLMLFIQPGKDFNPLAHIDYVDKDTLHHYSFNLLCRGQGRMMWFERPNKEGSFLAHPNSPNHIFYETFNHMKLKKIAEWTTDKAALVKTGTPHVVINLSNEKRLCLSVRIDDIGWENANKLFDIYFKENP